MSIQFKKERFKNFIDLIEEELDHTNIISSLKDIIDEIESDLVLFEDYVLKIRDQLADLNDEIENEKLTRIIKNMKGVLVH